VVSALGLEPRTP